MAPKTVRETFDESTFKQLKEQKGERTWSEAILEEFGVNND